MISAITGTVAHVHDTDVELRVGPLLVSVLFAACDKDQFESMIGREITLNTLLYLEGDPNRGNLEPRMIGFLNKQDRAFFDLFTTVKGIGPKKALRALSEPIAAVAHAIESKNIKFLTGLNGIAKRGAELIVAELSGKLAAFALEDTRGGAASAALSPPKRSSIEEDAILTLVTLGERRADAEALFERAQSNLPPNAATDALVREMLRLRAR